jgi:electron transfer flavoprotein beta subunit
MKILVAAKRVMDHNVKPRIKSDGSGVDLSNAKMSINPFDEIAVEAAVRLKEHGSVGEVVVVSIGPKAAQETLRSALAMGADRAILVETDVEVEPLGVAKLLAAIAQEEQPGIFLLGKQAIDNDYNATAQMLAAKLGWGQATFASSIVIAADKATVAREVDGGIETLDLALPTVISVDLRLNEPRYASLPNIMKAKAKPLAVRHVAEFAMDLSPRLEILETVEPKSRQAGRRFTSVEDLYGALKAEGLVA